MKHLSRFDIEAIADKYVQAYMALPDVRNTQIYKSAIAFGKAEIVTEDAEKIHGLRLISERFLPQHMDAFDLSIARSLSRTAVVRITLIDICQTLSVSLEHFKIGTVMMRQGNRLCLL